MKNHIPPKKILSITAALALGSFVLTPAYSAPLSPDQNTGNYHPGDPGALAGEHAERSVNAEVTVEEVTDRIIVKFVQSDGRFQQENLAAGLADQSAPEQVETEAVREFQGDISIIQLSEDLDPAEQQEVVAALEADPNVLYAEPDLRIVNGGAGNPGNPPNDPYWGQQWNMREANVPNAWKQATGRGIVIGIADEGTRYHPDLTPQEIPGHDFVSLDYSKDGDGWDPDPTDPGDWYPGFNSLWHGLHVAGVAAAKTGNGMGVAGVAPDARVQHARVMGLAGRSYISDYAAGLMWSAGVPVAGAPRNPTPAHVVNFSGAVYVPSCPAVFQDAINLAAARKVSIVVSAGNSGVNAAGATPANCPGAIVVGATGPGKVMTAYSNWGAYLDLLAPGGSANGSILSTHNNGLTTPGQASYGYMSGTSMAAPHVTGTIALMKERNPALTVEQIRSILRTHNGGLVNGYPFLNTAAAVQAVAPTYRLVGAIGNYYRANGGATTFGAPTGNEYTIRGGAVQHFAKNYSIYWSEPTGALPVYRSGAIGQLYLRRGAENGPGYPLATEVALPGGAMQTFARGAAQTGIWWSPSTGAKTLNTRGAIYWHWRERGYVSNLGYPVTDEQAIPGGAVTYFRNSRGAETGIYWSPSTGAKSLNSRGAIYWHWIRNGYTSTFGFPTTNEVTGADGLVRVRFSSGKTINWSAARGTWVS